LLSRPELSARVADIDRAAVVMVIGTDPINEAPIIDLRLRKAMRRFGAKLVIASSRPTALDGGAAERLRFVPGGGEALLRALQKALLEVENGPAPGGSNGFGSGERPGEPREDAAPGATPHERPAEQRARGANGGADREGLGIEGQTQLAKFLAENSLERLAQIAEVEVEDLREAAALLTAAENVVVVWGERLGHGEGGGAALAALGDLALVLGLDAGEGSGLIEIPATTNGRGLREVGCTPGLGPGLADTEPGLTATRAREAAARGEVKAFYLLHADPIRELAEGERWDEALGAATFVVAHEQFLGASAERHADVVFPTQAYAEKEGTMTHPDGRLQRLRPAVGRPGGVRVEWQVLIDLGVALGLDVGHHPSAGAIFGELAERSPLYRGITLDEIGGRGIRWQEREASRAAASEALGPLAFSDPGEPRAAPAPGDGELRLATRRDLWASWETDYAPSLEFLRPRQELVLNPADAERLGLARGDVVRISSNGSAIEAQVAPRGSVKEGTGHLTEGTAEQNANALTNGLPPLIRVTKPSAEEQPPSAAKAADGFDEG
jgi:NADH-quinone oxidoreductase subunit G